MNTRTDLEELQAMGAVLRGRFVYKSLRQGEWYIDKDMILPNGDDVTNRLEKCPHFENVCMSAPEIGVVIGPAVAGAVFATLVGLELGCPAIYADKDGDGFRIREPFKKLLNGANVLITEDLTTTGNSAKSVVEAVRACGGNVVAVYALANRGKVTKEMLGVPMFETMFTVEFDTYAPDEVPEWLAAIPISTTHGHGVKK
jgi:orotate phosphoribosyltransferase